MLRIAKVLKSNGTDGGILLGLFDIEPEEIDLKGPVFIYFDELAVPFFVLDAKEKGRGKAIVHLNDVTSLADAEEMVGREVFIEGEDREEEDFDLTGWTLLDKGREVGTITGMEPIPGNLCIYVGDVLIPLHEDFVISADEDARTIDLDIPEGLI